MLCPEEAEKTPSLPRISGFREPAGRPLVLSIPGPNKPWTTGPSPCEVRPLGLLGQLGETSCPPGPLTAQHPSPQAGLYIPWVPGFRVASQHSSLQIAQLYAKHPIGIIPYTHYLTAWSRHHHEPILQMRKLRPRGAHTQQRRNRIGTQTQVCLTQHLKLAALECLPHHYFQILVPLPLASISRLHLVPKHLPSE